MPPFHGFPRQPHQLEAGNVIAAAELAGLLRASPDAPAEAGSARLLEDIAGGPLTAGITVGPADGVTGEELALLQAADGAGLHRRSGRLHTADGTPVARVSELVVTGRLPGPARPLLGIDPDGALRPGRYSVQLGHALRGRGVRRQLLGVGLTPGRADDEGRRQALRLTTLLRAAGAEPLALSEERVYEEFLAMSSLPWPAW